VVLWPHGKALSVAKQALFTPRKHSPPLRNAGKYLLLFITKLCLRTYNLENAGKYLLLFITP
jgi:hypothetical protein